LVCIRDCIDRFGAVAYQNTVGISVEGFLELLDKYLRSTFATWESTVYLQRQGVCIGSCIAPVVSDLFLASIDRIILEHLEGTKVARVFRYVDDFLVLLKTDVLSFRSSMTHILGIFSDCLSPLVLTHEVPEAGCIRVLDLTLTMCPDHVCWAYDPRAGKPLLPFESAHSKIVKRAIAKTCYTHALRRSCFHKVQHSFDKQTERLTVAGFPSHVLTAVAESLLKETKTWPETSDISSSSRKGRERRKFAVIPYMHGLAHNLKRIAGRCNVDVLFTAPDKLSRLCRAVNPSDREARACTTKHRNRYVTCAEGVVYSLPLSCGRRYVGQTGRCLNDGLREHSYNVTSMVSGHLGIHCRDCSCQPQFQQCEVVKRHRDQLTREILEALEIERLGVMCVSSPSVASSRKDINFLAA
ncbi:unnamed protein product, partial [Ixodes persulcatus]